MDSWIQVFNKSFGFMSEWVGNVTETVSMNSKNTMKIAIIDYSMHKWALFVLTIQ